ncbi:Unknown protein sequence [Pseudomonas syringae pv. maculicola]|nr:Unknown protein sequence [Pseudomonas syringae pv. maculicola]RMV00496.1 hypothetical protein ALP19_102392 [Pseudomonas syringae pv. tomato]
MLRGMLFGVLNHDLVFVISQFCFFMCYGFTPPVTAESQ